MRPWILRGIGLLFGVGVLALAISRPQSTGSSAQAAPTKTPDSRPPPAPEVPVGVAADRVPAVVGANGPSELRKERFRTQEDGSPIPPLPADAPRNIRFGVILFSYAGAELAEKEAPSREEAEKRALAVIDEARADFAAAVNKGDAGSSVSVGRIGQGILEPSVEHALFRLKKGEVSEKPIDTPRGFWVVRRNE